MKKIILSLLLSSGLFSPLWAVEDYVWTTPSQDCCGSMPLGGGDIGINVWVTPENNDIHCLISQSGCFDENNTLLKFGYVHIHLQDSTEQFKEQRLCLEKGSMQLTFDHTTVELWVDVFKPVMHIEANLPISVEYENWRTQERHVNRYVCQQCSWKWALPKNAKTTTLRDSIQTNNDGSIIAWHQNKHFNVLATTMETEKMGQFIDSIYNPIKDRIFGGQIMKLSDNNQWAIVLCNQQTSLDEWQKQLSHITKSIHSTKDKRATQDWWHDYWQRSFIESDGKAQEALRNYTLFRYMLGCNAHPAKTGERWPTKFNGGLFTFDPLKCDSILYEYDQEDPGIVTPDYRKWGGGTHTAQNQRLVYWPMLQTGDFDALQAQLDFYIRLLPTAELRTRHYWQHNGACFTEQLENFGMPNIAEYGKHRDGGDPGVEDNRWLEYEWDTALEFADMYCLYPHEQSPYGKKKSQENARRLILSCLRFFEEHYTEVDSLDYMAIFPGSGCETYKMARNSASTVAGLIRLSTDALNYRKELDLSDKEVEWLQEFQHQLPLIPVCEYNGKTCIAPADSWERIQNVETPQLYPVWPWRMVDKEIAYNTYYNDSIALKHRTFIGWKQDNIWAAYIGDADEAWKLTMQKLVVKEKGPKWEVYRFPAFWGPGYDWMPDHNWGGSAMIGLHAMLMQEDNDGNIILLPAWPKDQNVHFRLWASRQRQVEVEYRDGQILQYTINGEEQPELGNSER